MKTDRRRKGATLYERAMLTARWADERDPDSCLVWTGSVRGGYPYMNVRRDGRIKHIAPHRVVLEELTGFEFPFDEGGHLCNNEMCIRPLHLEIQTPAHNKAERRGYVARSEARWIPVLFPRPDPAEAAVARFFASGGRGELTTVCPF